MTGVLPFNKLFIMVPLMLAARKIDSEDPATIYYLRLAYGSIQSIIVVIVLYTYIQASAYLSSSSATSSSTNTSTTAITDSKKKGSSSSTDVVYVPGAPTPFADPNAKKKYTMVLYSAHVITTARSLVGSTLFGIAMTIGLHLYKGMAVGLAMQAIMGPLSLLENPLVKSLLLGNGFKPDDRIFDEKLLSELSPDDEIVDESGKVVVVQIGEDGVAMTTTTAATTTGTNATTTTTASAGTTFEDLLLDTWDAGNKADIGTLMSAINTKICNFRTKENGWTPLMILSGLNAKGTGSAIRQVIELGGNPAIVDAEGWNALHWAAFHGSIDAARELAKDTSLMIVKDKEGKVPLDMAKLEGNEDVAKFLESIVTTAATTTTADGSTTDGIRKRK